MKYLKFMVLVATIIFFNACGEITPSGDALAVEEDAEALDANDIVFNGNDNPSSVTTNFTLPTSGQNDTTITWAENADPGNNVVLSGTGNSSATVSWKEENGFGPYTVTLKATITKGTEKATKNISITVFPPATQKVCLTVDGVSFKMVLVPGGLTFPTGTDDNSIDTIDYAYWIGETEVTYELWKKVYDWATDTARGANKYTFKNPGTMGDGNGDTPQHPVTTVCWIDCVVWCNALTEWYNAHMGTSYECVYTYSNEVIRDPSMIANKDENNIVARQTAKGFRLFTSIEYECAARYKGNDSSYGAIECPASSGMWWTPGEYASGAKANIDNANETKLVAVYYENPGGSTAEVKSKLPNVLGLYDMSGNVWELTFTMISPIFQGNPWLCTRRGGSFFNNDNYFPLQVGQGDWVLELDQCNNEPGFRIVRNH